MHVFLETERLVLRRFTVNDADLLVELDSDPEVMYFITGGRQTPRREIESEILPAYLEYYERYAGFGFWAAIERSSGEFVGWFHFRPESEDDPDQIELGYRLRRSVWGMGYATEGSRALIEKASSSWASSGSTRRRWWSTWPRAACWRRLGCGTSGRSISPGRTRSRATSTAMSSTRS